MNKLTFCANQIKRLASKAFFPSAPEGIAELAYTLDKYTASEDHAIRVIDAAVIRRFGPEEKQEDRCPGPSDLWGICHEISDQRPAGKECDPACMDCQGSSWRVIERNGVEGSQRCACGERPASQAALDEHWRKEKARIGSEERAAYARWREDFARDPAFAGAKHIQPASEAEIESLKAEQARNRGLSGKESEAIA